jgi:hypothetical protein
MHPELMNALARERQAELFRLHQLRHDNLDIPPPRVRRTRQVVERARRSLGLILLSAGTRLLRKNRSSIDLANSQH